MQTCFMVLLGDFSWDRVKEVGRVEAGVWFWSFNVLVVWVMLNMLLAIVKPGRPRPW